MKYIGVKFTPYGKTYDYKCDDPDIAPGDKAVVCSPAGIFSVVTVIVVHEAYEPVPGVKYTWIVQRVNTTNYLELVEADKASAPAGKERL